MNCLHFFLCILKKQCNEFKHISFSFSVRVLTCILREQLGKDRTSYLLVALVPLSWWSDSQPGISIPWSHCSHAQLMFFNSAYSPISGRKRGMMCQQTEMQVAFEWINIKKEGSIVCIQEMKLILELGSKQKSGLTLLSWRLEDLVQSQTDTHILNKKPEILFWVKAVQSWVPTLPNAS